MLTAKERLLLAAAKRGAVDTCRQILETDDTQTVSVNVRDKDKTPLLLAAEEGHVQTVEFLLQHKADVRATDPVGMTALHLAAWMGHVRVVSALLNEEEDHQYKKAGVLVNARNHIGQTPLHGAALCAHYAVVCLLLKHGADPNIQSMARQRLPLHEVALRADKHKERLKIYQLLLQCSPDTLYTVFFCKRLGGNCSKEYIADWFGRMIAVIRDVNDCRIFYTILQTARLLGLVNNDSDDDKSGVASASDLAERAMDQCAEYCESAEDWRTLWILLQKACVEDKLVSSAFFQMMQDYYGRIQDGLEKRVVSLDLQVSVRRGIRRLQTGVDGSVTTLKTCFMFFLQSIKGTNTLNKDNNATRNKKIDALVGVVGTLLNAILMGRHTYDHHFRKLLARSTDLLDPLHLENGLGGRDFPANQRESLHTALQTGLKVGRNIWQEGSDQQWQFNDVISREDGLIIVGLCAGALGRCSLQQNVPSNNSTDNQDAVSVNSADSGNTKMSTYTTLTIAKNVFREDTFLSPEEEEILQLHKAVKYCNECMLDQALEVVTREDTLNAVDSVGRTALDLAALTGQMNLMDKIYVAGGKPAYFKNEVTVLKIAKARSKHLHTYKSTVEFKSASAGGASVKDDVTADTQSLSVP